MVGILSNKAASRGRTRDCRIRRAIKEVGQSMSIVQIAEETPTAASIGGLRTSRIGERFTWSTEYDARNPREEEVCQVFMLL